MDVELPSVPIFDLRRIGMPGHALARREQVLALREACLGWLPAGALLGRLGDPLARDWLGRSRSPLVAEIEAVAAAIGCSGIWLLHGAYVFGCTAFADESERGPVLKRTLDWPFPGLGRLVEIAEQKGPAGNFLNVTWPGFVGVLTALAPGRFAASINQAPMRHRTRAPSLRWVDYACNAVGAFCSSGRAPPEHVLRHVFETCATFDEALHLLETAPLARPVLFTLVGCAPNERAVIERDGKATRTWRDDTVVANAWRNPEPGWRSRVCGSGAPEENNARRRAAMLAADHASCFGWATAPVVNACTRLAVEMCPSTGRLAVAGWEADGVGHARRVTTVTETVGAPSAQQDPPNGST